MEPGTKEVVIGMGAVIAIIIFFVLHNFYGKIKADKITLVSSDKVDAATAQAQLAMLKNGGAGYGTNYGGGGYNPAGAGYANVMAGNSAGNYQTGNSGLLVNQQNSGTNAFDVAAQQNNAWYLAGSGIGNAFLAAFGGDDEEDEGDY